MKFVSPGVYVREIDLSLYIPTLSSTIAAVVVTATKGPINERTFVSNPNSFVAIFGQPHPDHLGTYAAMQYLRRGRQLWVVRVAGSSSETASATLSAVKLANVSSTIVPADGTQVFELTATTNRLKIKVTDSRTGVAANYTGEIVLTPPVAPATTLSVKEVAEDLAKKLRSDAALTSFVTAVAHADGTNEKLFIVGKVPSTQVTFQFEAASSNDGLAVLGFTAGTPVTPTAQDGTFELKAKSAGTWGNALTVQTTLNPQVPFTFDLGVYQSSEQFSAVGNFKGLRTELHQGLSLDSSVVPIGGGGTSTNPRWIAEVIGTVNSSTLVATYEPGRSASLAYELTTDDTLLSANVGMMKFVLPVTQSVTLTSGDDGLETVGDDDYVGVTLGSVRTGLQLYRNPEEIDINLLMVPGQTSPAVINELLVICEERGDSMAIVDTPDNYSVQQAVDWHNGQGQFADHQSFSSSYGAMYYSWLKVFDAYNNTYVWTPPSGHVAAIYAYTDYIAETWTAPAGFNRAHIVAAIDVRYSPDLGERELMYGNFNALNPIVKFPKDGITVWGQRTLQRAPTALDRVNVRRLLLYLRKVVARAVKYLVFEPNDPATWRRFVNLIEPFMETVKTRRGVYDYAVICDETTNTPDVIDQNTMVGRIYLKPTKAAEVINVDFVLTTTGAKFEEVVF
jgi:uncharacterized protein